MNTEKDVIEVEANPFESHKPLEEMKVGEWVIFYKGRGNGELCKIKRLTNTQIVIEAANYVNEFFERKFHKGKGWKNGHEVGSMDSYYTSRIIPYTVSEWDKILQYRRYQKVSSKLSISESDTDKVNKAYDFLLEIELITPISKQ